ncbi:hypothetical protein L7F22_066332 [Adiantum nelumboides]|nr:hypothetical protein [Adiantum nelumboides]
MAKPIFQLLPILCFLLLLPAVYALFLLASSSPTYSAMGRAAAVEEARSSKRELSSHVHSHADRLSEASSSNCRGCDGLPAEDSLLSNKPSAMKASSSAHAFQNVIPLAMEEDSSTSTRGSSQHLLHPQTFFEVSTPLDPPPHSPCSSLHVFSHCFAYTYGLPPPMANYTPPSANACDNPSNWTLIVLWAAI